MPSKTYMLKQLILKEIPPGELPQVIFGRLMLKTGITWALIGENDEIPPERLNKALAAAEEIFSKKFYV